MAVINQPASQIKLTNVSLVRMKRGKKRFEIACYQNKVQDWRLGVEKDLDEVLQIPQVFLNVSKGQTASNDDLITAFGSTNQDLIISEILDRGEIQLNEKERVANLRQKQNEFLNIISTKCINPKSKKRYPPSMIQKALSELKFHLNPNKPAKLQALEAIKLLVSKQLFPIERASMKVKVILVNRVKDDVYEPYIKPLLDQIDEESSNDQVFESVSIIDPTNYRLIVEILQGENAKINNGEGTVEVIDMAILKSDS